MVYLLDADTLITGDRNAYPVARFPVVWEWLLYQGTSGRVRIPIEQYEEVVRGRGDLVDWLRVPEHKQALVLGEDADLELVQRVLEEGYGPNVNEEEIEEIGRDPFLIAHAMACPGERTVVTFEVSAPSRRRARRKVPDVCAQFGVTCINLFGLIRFLDFTMDWEPPQPVDEAA